MKPTKEQTRIYKFIAKRSENIIIEALAGAGKCLGINTSILMYDGSIKMVQDIKVGDLLMGDDSTPRKVLNANQGYGDLYETIPTKGDKWVCNDVHVMTLFHEQKKELIDIPLNEISTTKYPNGNYRSIRLQKTGVNFNKKNKLIIDPYLIGLWLGDGEKNNGSPRICLHKKEIKIINYLKNINYHNITPKIFVDKRNKNVLTISLTTENYIGGFKRNILREEFKTCINNNNEKKIPIKYLTTSYDNRLKLFAGLIDSDGYNAGNYYEIITKYVSLKNDILYLCRSLGYGTYAYIKKIKHNNKTLNYWRISISGSFEDVPVLLNRKKCEKRKQIKSPLRNSFKVNYIGKGDYYGFTLNGNGRFLLGDFTITHNTTTIVEGAKLIPKGKSCIFLAFNKHIQKELKTRLPEETYCYTFHGLGNGAIKRKYGDSIVFDEFKVDHIIRKKAKNWKLNDEYPTSAERLTYLGLIKSLVDLCRLTLTMNKKYLPMIADKYEINLTDKKDFNRVFSVLELMVNDRKQYDFIDMVFLPAIDNKIWLFQHDYVFTDEIQDLNRAQQKMIEKCLKRDKVSKKIVGRLIGIGDSNQSIYGFMGASERSFDWFRRLPNTKILPLSYTFRCSKAIVKKAQTIVADIKAFDNAPMGIVRDGDVLTEARDGDFILCRTTKPLIKLFFHFLLENKKSLIRGYDFGLSLIDMTVKHKTIPKLLVYWTNELEKYRVDLRKKGIINPQEHSGYSSLEDKVMVLEFIGNLSVSINDINNKIKTIFRDEIEGIVLSTIHKSKGLEADRVFIVRPDKLPLPVNKAWQFKQEKNLEYVAITRARSELIYDHEWTDEDET